MAGEARSVVVRLTAENAQYIAAMRASGAVTDATATQVEAAARRQSQAYDTLGSKAGKAGLAAALGLAAMGKAAVDWESQFAGVEKTVDGTASELGVLEGELRGLAKTMPATHEEIAGVAEAAGQLGVAREDISEFTETMVQLGETTNLTAQDAATSIAQMANVMGTAPDEIDKVGAALVALGNDGASTEAEILGMAQRIAGAGAQIGLAESDILGIANAASSMGIEVEAGGSAISRVFTELAKATAQGGEDLDAFADIAGMSAEEFTKAFEEDPASAFASFTEGLNRINESGGDVFTTLDQLGLSDTRVSRALLSMAGSGDLLRESLELGADAFGENTALTDEYGKRLETTASQAQVAWNQIKDAGISAGNELLPVIAKAAGLVGDLAGAFGDLPAPVKSSLTGLLGITALFGGGLWFGSKVIGGVTSTRVALAELATTSPRAARGLSMVVKAGGALAALEVGAAILDTLRESARDAAPDIDALNAALAATDASALSAELGGSLSDLLDAADTGALEGLSIGVGEYVDKMGLAGDALDVFVPGLHTQQDAASKTTDALTSLDAALTALAAEKGPVQAAASLRYLAQQEGLSASELDTLIGLLPKYKAAVGDAAGGTDDLAGAQGGLADLLDVTGGAAEGTAEDLEKLAGAAGAATGAMKQLGGYLDRADAMAAYGDAIRETTKALKDGFDPKDKETIRDIGREIIGVSESLAKKPAQQRSFLHQAKDDLEAFIQSNPKAKDALGDLLKYVNKGLDDLKNTDTEVPVGMDDDDFKAGAETVARRTKALNFLKANPDADLMIDAFAAAFNLTKRDLAWLDNARAMAELDANPAGVISGVNKAQAALRAIDGTSVTTYIATVHTASKQADGGMWQDGVKAYAGGGMNYGQGAQVSRKPMMVQGGANILWGEPETGWEAYISGKPSERERNIAILGMAADRLGVRLLQAQGGLIANTYARGGVAGQGGGIGGDMPPFISDLINDIGRHRRATEGVVNVLEREQKAKVKALRQDLRDAEKRTEALREELDTAKQVRDGWDQAIESLSETITGKLTSDLFGENASFESIVSGLESDRARAAEFMDAERILGENLSGDALQALLEQTSPEQVIDFASNWTAEQLNQFEHLFNQTQDAREAAGLLGGDEVFGSRRDAAAEEVAGLRADLQKAEKREKRLAELAEDADKKYQRLVDLAEDNPGDVGEAVGRQLNNTGGRAARTNGRGRG